MKKNTLFTILLLMICTSILGQYSFYKEISSEYGYVNSKVFMDGNNFLLLANRSDINENVNPDIDYSPIIFKINAIGEITDSLVWINSQQNTFFNEIIILNNGTIGIIGSAEKNDQPGFFKMFYFIADDQMNLIGQYYFDLGLGRLEYTQAFINTFNHISIAASIEQPDDDFLSFDKLIMEISLEGDLIFDSIYDNSTLDLIYDFIPIINTSNYLLYCNYGISKYGEIDKLNSDYNLINSYYSEDQSTVRSIINTSDNGFISSALSITGNETAWLPSFRKYNNSIEEVSNIEFGVADTSFWPALYNSISSIDNNNFHSGFTYNIDKQLFYSSQKSYLSVYAIDKDLNLQWNMLYGGDAYYRACDIASSYDNGSILTGTVYRNGSNGPKKANLFIIKTDENGLITSIDDEPNIPIQNAIIAPNPGQNYLQLHTGMYPALLKVFNINGQVVLEEDIHQNTTTINTSSLKSGTFVWKLIKDGELVETGKWVKE
jgi:hypothetical protein